MAMVKEFMGQPLVELAFHHGPSNLKRCNIQCQLHKKVPLLPPTFSEVKTAAAQVQQSPPAPPAPFPKHALNLNPVTLKITGSVTIKTSMTTEEEFMAMMLQHFDTISARGIVMQLVSTQIHPSKHSSLISHLTNVFSIHRNKIYFNLLNKLIN